jgi:hypothetical protein
VWWQHNHVNCASMNIGKLVKSCISIGLLYVLALRVKPSVRIQPYFLRGGGCGVRV